MCKDKEIEILSSPLDTTIASLKMVQQYTMTYEQELKALILYIEDEKINHFQYDYSNDPG